MSYMKELLGDTDFEEMEKQLKEKGIAEAHIYMTGAMMERNLMETYNIWLKDNGRQIIDGWIKVKGNLITDEYSIELGRYIIMRFLLWVVNDI